MYLPSSGISLLTVGMNLLSFMCHPGVIHVDGYWWRKYASGGEGLLRSYKGSHTCFQGCDSTEMLLLLTVLLESSILDHVNSGFTNTTYRRASSSSVRSMQLPFLWKLCLVCLSVFGNISFFYFLENDLCSCIITSVDLKRDCLFTNEKQDMFWRLVSGGCPKYIWKLILSKSESKLPTAFLSF